MQQIDPGQVCALCVALLVIAQEICIICRTYKEYTEYKRKNEAFKAKCAKLHIDVTPATNAKH